MKEKRPVLSEKPEDQQAAAVWGRDQMQRMKRNKEIGDELRAKMRPFIHDVAVKMGLVSKNT